MRLIDLASGSSFWRGIDYHHQKRVKTWKQIDKYKYQGEVNGSNNGVYHVEIDLEHPRRSSCNCPFANGRRVICKHMIALYFNIFPEKEVEVMNEIEEQKRLYELELKQELENKKADIKKYVMSLTKKELQQKLLERMISDLVDNYEKRY